MTDQTTKKSVQGQCISVSVSLFTCAANTLFGRLWSQQSICKIFKNLQHIHLPNFSSTIVILHHVNQINIGKVYIFYLELCFQFATVFWLVRCLQFNALNAEFENIQWLGAHINCRAQSLTIKFPRKVRFCCQRSSFSCRDSSTPTIPIARSH